MTTPQIFDARTIDPKNPPPPDAPLVFPIGQAGLYSDGTPQGQISVSMADEPEFCAEMLKHFREFPETGPDIFYILTPDAVLNFRDGAESIDVKVPYCAIHTTFIPNAELSAFMVGASERVLSLSDTPESRRDFEPIFARNKADGCTPPDFSSAEAEAEIKTDSTNSFPVHTGQETDCLIRSAGDGRGGFGWRNEIMRGVRVWEGGTHRVEVPNVGLSNEPQTSFSDVERLTESQNSDFALALFYIAGVLVPPMQPEKAPLIGAWIDLNDVIEKIGWMAEKPDAEKREKLRAQIWDYIQYGQRAVVAGRRSTPYKDPVTRREIPTQIESPVWAITDVRRPQAPGSAAPLAPVKVRVVISEQWETMLRDPLLCQWLPLGELLGTIAPHKVGGDWARIIGLSLARLARMKSREVTAGEYNPTRRQLLTHYTPKTQTAEWYLESSDPKRAVKYYREALNILAEKGLIAQTGDAAPDVTPAKILKPYGRKGWGAAWLDGESGVQIGELWRPAVQKCANALPERAPKDLKAKPHARKRAK